jgi:hypothetical protein
MEGDSRSVKFKIKPKSYPLIKVHFKNQHEYEDDMLESEVAFPQEFWLDLANNCKEVAAGMGTFGSQKIVSGLNLMAQTIMAEIQAEQKRLHNKDAYESLVDFVFEINNRSDLDKVRKGQMIHDRACQLKF